MTMKLMIVAGCLAALAAAVQAAEPPLTQQGYDSARKKIEAQYEADRKICDRLEGHAEDVCEKQAKGREKADTAWLEARYRPSPEALQEARTATAEAHYDIDMERCEARRGKAKSRCEDEAQAAREAAIRQARVEKVQAQREARAKAREAATPARKATAAGPT
jgi:hypothetical protein